MSRAVVAPSTMEGIKRFAKSIKRNNKGLSHARALDQAAEAAGFQNLRHAQKTLPRNDSPRGELHPLYLTAYWRTREGDTGRETLLIHTRLCWPQLLTPKQLFSSRLRHFRIDAADHLETRVDLHGKAVAQNAVCTAAATIQFMEASGLRPVTRATRKDWIRDARSLPKRDHSTEWMDTSSGQVVFCDEPYSTGPELLAERNTWAEQRSLVIKTTKWPGMYAPGFSALFLLSNREFTPQLTAIVRKLDSLPTPPVAADWQGESAAYNPVFVSPGRKASGRIKRSRPRLVYPGLERAGAIAFGRMFVGMQWRPNAKMPLASHKRVGELLKGLQELGVPSPAWHRIESVRSELDEWIQREYTNSELSQEQFSEMYYGRSKAADTDRVAMILEVLDLLRASYPNCGPLRTILRTLNSIHRTIAAHAAKRAARQQQPESSYIRG